MCRLFALHAMIPVRATFWLIDAPDSLRAQSHRDPDGAGIGVFDASGRPVVDKRPIAAYRDEAFATEARELSGVTFVAHVRYASTGELTEANTHPFALDGRIFAHNGVVADLDVLDRELTRLGVAGLVLGQTDSERVFALITAHVRRHDGDVDAGLAEAVNWIVGHLGVYSLNLVLATPDRVWALRYPQTHELHLLVRGAGHPRARAPLDARSRRIHARSEDLAHRAHVVVASEALDDESGWRLLDPGELVRIDPDLSIHAARPVTARAAHLLSVSELDPTAAASQHPARGR